jgi:predicted DsbA family dithiol-disulfide isomerase
VAFARVSGAEDALLARLYDALWTRDRDISRMDVLADEGAAIGLDRDALHLALGLDRFQDEVVREQDAAESAGIAGVPAVQYRDHVAVGLLPVHDLVEWLDSLR